MSLKSSDTAASGDEPRPVTTPESSVLVAVQKVARNDATVRAARGMSHFGEHSLGWLAIAGTGAVLTRNDPDRQRKWILAGVGAFGAHAASVIIKRVVRRPRPTDPRVIVGVGTPSKLSFPSSHATSTTAAAILIGQAAGLPKGALPAAIVPPMLLSRLVLGVHYPTDVLAGAAIGAASAAAVTTGDKLIRRMTRRGSGRARSRAITVGVK
ncbi:phosphatase PAP2 family protein [Jongsikchunia kroppenstedtii]|uniref:phosphatase PAP2 family protein n=1 Tax=Jongsikchunia kroppenstedtii TaxID=1121721 RepID=UPI00039ED917|nr:phosphatase PAP2 family protein [Jongsikchunia kroppenstedtii]